ncbi:hypothetical protein [Isoptericola haloaureus]|uniref:Uncharacterized protein n=1 Tax=Isoptericola haloaureus TaxID=1542902 RepID=A0ABU7Z2C7_9MICO
MTAYTLPALPYHSTAPQPHRRGQLMERPPHTSPNVPPAATNVNQPR